MYLNNLTGARYGKLTVISPAGSRGGHMYWNCRCDCGNEKVARGSHLRSGNVKSCGCIPVHKTHGKRSSRLYGVWNNMILRCHNPNNPEYPRYGGRGIVVCDEWKNDFIAFYTWAMAAGYDEAAPRGQYTVERNDNDGPYSPENCKLANMKDQANNTRRNRFITYKGETKTVTQWARHLGIKQTTLSRRILSGWPVEKAFTEEVRKNVS